MSAHSAERTWFRDGTVAAAGALSAALGVCVLGAWHGHRMAWVSALPGSVPMPYDDACGFLLCGAALAALALRRGRPAAWLGAAAAAVAAWSLLSAGLGFGGGLESLWRDPVVRDAVPEALRSQPLSSAALLLAGAALCGLGASRATAARTAALLAGAALAGLGAVIVVCYAGSIATAFGWDYLTRLPIHSGAGLALAGAGLLAASWPEGSPAPGSRWLPAAAGLAAATASVILWMALKAEQAARIRWTVDGAAQELTGRFESLQERGTLLSRALASGHLFGEILPGQPPKTYGFSISLGGQMLYATPGTPSPEAQTYARDVSAALPDGDWRVRVWPSAEFLAAQRSLLPDAALALGLILAALLAWSTRLTQLARRQALEIARERERAEAASEAKSRFLANISREPRNPLNAVVGYAQLLLSGSEGPLNPEQEKDVQVILRGGRALAGLFDQLMELAQLEAGRVRLRRDVVKASQLLKELKSSFAGEAAKRGIELKVTASGDAALDADAPRLRRALERVVENAFKFTRRGAVTLGLTAQDSEVVFSIRDTGFGLSPEETRRLFEPFWQSERLDGIKKAEGLGLGLHLARRMVELHGGRMEAQGHSGAGSAFYVRLPAARGR